MALIANQNLESPLLEHHSVSPTSGGDRATRLNRPAGFSTVETVGLAVIVAMLLSAVAPVLRDQGHSSTADSVVSALSHGIQGKSAYVRSESWSNASGAKVRGAVASPKLEHGWGLPTLGLESFSAKSSTDVGSHVHNSARADACFVCGGASISARHAVGGAFEPTGEHNGNDDDQTRKRNAANARKGDLVSLDVEADAFIAPVFVRLQDTLTARFGPGKLRVHALADGIVGAQLTGSAHFGLGRNRQTVEAGGEAVLGAKGRVEVAASESLLGITASERAGAEGWLGLGATGKFALKHEGSKFEFGTRVGAALGIGGAIDYSTSIDFSGVSRYTKSATDFLGVLQ